MCRAGVARSCAREGSGGRREQPVLETVYLTNNSLYNDMFTSDLKMEWLGMIAGIQLRDVLILQVVLWSSHNRRLGENRATPIPAVPRLSP